MATVKDPHAILWHMAHAQQVRSLGDEWKAVLCNPYYIFFCQLVWSSYLFNL